MSRERVHDGMGAESLSRPSAFIYRHLLALLYRLLLTIWGERVGPVGVSGASVSESSMAYKTS